MKEASVPVLSPWLVEMAVTLPYLLTVSSLYEGFCVHISHFYVDTGHFGLEGIIMNPVELDSSSINPVSVYMYYMYRYYMSGTRVLYISTDVLGKGIQPREDKNFEL